MRSPAERNIILAAGGTGGHIFPAESLASALLERGYQPILITDKRHGNYQGTFEKLPVHTVRAGKLGKGVFKRALGAADIGVGYFQARSLLKKMRPLAVIGFGGYPSFPTMYAAVRNRYTTLIHEQNSILGQANLFLSSHVDAIATSFAEVSGLTEESAEKAVLTGNPVRPAIKTLHNLAYPDFDENGMLRILVTGGSQGAGVFSRVLPKAISLLSDELRARVRIDQQCRAENLDKVRARYNELGVSADLSTFFRDMPSRLAATHLVVARSGASTVSELAVAGRPVIMVPYPSAKDDHQTTNANALEAAGGGWLIPEEAFTAQTLAEKLEHFFMLPSVLQEAAENARNVARVDADKSLADLVEKMIKDKNSQSKKSDIIEEEENLDRMEAMG